MPASDHLNQPLFHGSVVPLKVGDVIKPSTQVGFSPHRSMYETSYTRSEDNHSRGDHVYMTHDEHGAWGWTGSALGYEDHEPELGEHPTPWTERSKRVYEVKPIGGAHRPVDNRYQEGRGRALREGETHVPGGELISGELVTQRGQGAVVVGERTIPPPDQWDGTPTQGELPGYNWEAQKAGSYRNSGNRNEALYQEQTKQRSNEAHHKALEGRTQPHLGSGPRPLSAPHTDAPLPGMENTAPVGSVANPMKEHFLSGGKSDYRRNAFGDQVFTIKRSTEF